MRRVTAELIKDKVIKTAILANIKLRADVLACLKNACLKEKNSLAKKAISSIIENAEIAQKKKIAICQDTGLPVVFAEIGNEVFIDGDIKKIIIQAVGNAYRDTALRASIQADPITRSRKNSFSPCIVHTDVIKGKKIKITLMPKGFGSENKAQVKMLSPTATVQEIEDFIVQTVKQAGASACPPYIIGVGIGGTQDYAALLAKKALLNPISKQNKNLKLAKLEKQLLKKINKLNIGAFGFKGKNTAIAVKIKTYPTHIAGLPVAVNISCHALRSASVTI
ncbi:MAG: fumarate hydratase [Candidatus Omnitrophota bacterium]